MVWIIILVYVNHMYGIGSRACRVTMGQRLFSKSRYSNRVQFQALLYPMTPKDGSAPQPIYTKFNAPLCCISGCSVVGPEKGSGLLMDLKAWP